MSLCKCVCVHAYIPEWLYGFVSCLIFHGQKETEVLMPCGYEEDRLILSRWERPATFRQQTHTTDILMSVFIRPGMADMSCRVNSNWRILGCKQTADMYQLKMFLTFWGGIKVISILKVHQMHNIKSDKDYIKSIFSSFVILLIVKVERRRWEKRIRTKSRLD